MSGKIEKCTESDKQHEGDVISVVYHENHVFSGGADGKIKIWNEDLTFVKDLNIHEGCYIYALAITPSGKIYSSSADGTIKISKNPLKSDESVELLRCDEDAIESLFCQNEVLYSGDDKGIVTMWENDKITFKFNLVEQVKSLAVEQSTIYTVRDLDAVVTEIMPGKSGKYSTKATIPGRAPLKLLGPIVDGRSKFLVFITRDGKGLTLVKNLPGELFAPVWNKDDCHEMIINSICGTEALLYSAGYDGKVKKWIDIDKDPKLAGEITIGNTVNTVCIGSNQTVYAGASDGAIRKLSFV